ncbi:MAG TPA: hypothetical protein VF174_15715 [Micromonosporaceae bacterium]
MSRMSRSAYGLTLDRGGDWRVRGLCTESPDMWCSSDRDAIALAQHTCFTHCTVWQQCAAEGEATPPDRRRGVIYGGARYLDHSGNRDRDTYVLRRSCARCRDGR